MVGEKWVVGNHDDYEEVNINEPEPEPEDESETKIKKDI